jgi:DNA repair exonuclease SbcCD ATPase subunit
MIPRKVTVENFLSYGSPKVEFDFDGEPLWILCGPNGAGKSAVFDAITYALFGRYRGADRKENKMEGLIHHGASSMSVELEFEFNGVTYRVSRKKNLKGPVKVAAAQRVIAAGETNWQPLPHINGVNELKAWVENDLGLNFNTFVCSVMLRQGKAEELLDADKDTRLKVLHGILDFEKYVALHRRVAEAVTRLGSDVKSLAVRLEKMPVIAEEELTAAQEAQAEAERQWKDAKAAVQAAGECLRHAEKGELLYQQRSAIQRDLQAAAERAQQADRIAAQIARLHELGGVLPVLKTLLKLQETMRSSAASHAALLQKERTLTTQRENLNRTLAQERQKGQDCRDALVVMEQEMQMRNIHLEKLVDRLQCAQNAQQLRREIAEGEKKLQQYPADLAQQLRTAEDQLQAARVAQNALPYLHSILEAKRTFQQTAFTISQATHQETAASSESARLQGELQTAQTACTAAREAHRKAEQEQTEAETLCKQATARLRKFRSVAGAQVCSECLQPIDAHHAAQELQKLNNEVALRQRLSAEKAAAVDTAAGVIVKLDHTWNLLQERFWESERQRQDAFHARSRAEGEQTKAHQTFHKEAGKLPAAYRTRLVDLHTPGFPTAQDVAQVEEQGATVSALEQKVGTLQRSQRDVEIGRTNLQAKYEELKRLGDQPLPSELAQEQSRLAQELAADSQRQSVLKKAWQTAEAEKERLEKDLKRKDQEALYVSTELAKVGAEREGAERQATEARNRLAPVWLACADALQQSQLTAWEREHHQLQQSGVERLAQVLATDLALRESREQQVRELEGQLQQLPPEACRPVVEVKAQVHAAEQAESAAEERRNSTARHWEQLQRQDAERKQLLTEQEEIGKQYDLHNRLAELLGKKGLQRNLVRDAEREIVDLANETLSRVSNGELQFELPSGQGTEDDSETVFDLSVRQSGQPYATGVAFLSGSQRFRVAIALALAVGRFASRQARPLEAVIIDEGFGCLDRIGRLGMIEELLRLQRPSDLPHPLKRIILVSHHEDFADSFSVGYQLTQENGETHATAFRK